MEKKTPLYDIHVAEGGKIVPFAGYLLPVQYAQGVVKEHMAVRTQAGLFDVSHMGEITFSGPGALDSLNHLLTNDFTNMNIGRVRYSPMCNAQGGCVDDVLVYKFGEQNYLVVVNAANKDKDFQHMKSNILADTVIEDISDSIAQIALQGPASREILQTILDDEAIPEKYYTAIEHVDIAGFDCMISRTGYTGELGYEIYTDAANAVSLWQLLREKGEPFGCIPCGLGARDTLRLEAAMPLYGHEMDDEISPFEAGLDFAVKMDKSDFIGKEALVQKGEIARVRVGLEGISRGIMREHQDVYVDGVCIGSTTSGTHAPFVGHAIAMALIDVKYAHVGQVVEVDVRGRFVQARVVDMPFIQK